MLRSSLVGHFVNVYCVRPINRLSSAQQVNLNKVIKLNNLNRIENYRYFGFESAFVISPHQSRSRLPTLDKNVLVQRTLRYLSESGNPPTSNPAEMKLIDILKEKFPSATDIAVVDISGGCGSMYEVFVESPDFKGIRLMKQHKMVTEALKSEIKDMHGLRISTVASE